jgi:hypothetical protein
MSKNLHIVFSQPPAEVSEEEFNTWYDAHLGEILAVPGFLAARRFRLQPVVAGPGGPLPYGFLVIYEVEGDPADAVRNLEQAGMGSIDLYSELKEVEEGTLPLPDWFERASFASWNCLALGERVEAPAS